ncbi:lipid A biosynthesis acyltransferase [Marinobacterium sp. D7]|uniref:LpxL/LpxP family acyltransferase n=1 Tax=Marinobacterium ramblicola TaxID=2849041 RepID=UPI001C2DD2CE|nr:lipid A biosynthesis acyltransferase [Marinobacterium ramblicola]MBV1788288.1 lipid A biosynthesis acyltransferase [Marinobacterium ramblicola]
MADSSKHWAGIGEAGTLLGMKTLLLAYRLFGRAGFRVFLFPVMSYFYLTRRASRQASRGYLARVQRLLPAEQRGALTPFRHFWCFGEILLDKLLVWMGHIRHQDVVFATPEVFDEVDKSRSGGIIIVSHLGNTEVCSALAHQLPGIGITMLVYTRHAEKFNRLMKQANPDASINLMQVTDMSPATAMLLSERVQAGEYVVIAGDRTPVSGRARTSTVEFMGDRAEFPQGAFILASLLRCPVYLMFCLKESGQYHLYLEKFSEHLSLPRKERAEGLQQAVQRYADRLTAYCCRAPLQWFNFFPFWQADQEPQTSPVPEKRQLDSRS